MKKEKVQIICESVQILEVSILSKLRVYELAKELGIPSKRIIELLAGIGVEVKNHMSTIEEKSALRIKAHLRGEDPEVDEVIEEVKKAEEKKPEAKKEPARVEPKKAEPKKAEPGKAGDRKAAVERPKSPTAPGKSPRGPSAGARPQRPAFGKRPPKEAPKSRKARKAERDAQKRLRAQQEEKIIIEGRITPRNLAEVIEIDVAEIITRLVELGVMATINEPLELDVINLIADEFDINMEAREAPEEVELLATLDQEKVDPKQLKSRPPVVTVLGHVDHGKTSLLDAIREANVTAQEAGGITQHIGAYQVNINGKKVTFLDTPGHEAFTAMRARGAKATDIAILVVAADDGVMPQTVEALNHVKAAGVPMMVAVNKIDKENANPDRVKQQLSDFELVPEEWGGETIFVHVSALKKEGLKELLEMILLVAEMAELRANPQKKAQGTVIEAKLDKGRGVVATVLISDGTLCIGDPVICGSIAGRVRAMSDDKGKRIKKAGPSTPVEVLGLSEVPEAGDPMQVVEDEKLARQIAGKRMEKKREFELKRTQKVTLEDLFSRIKEGEMQELNIILKADVHGSAEALRESLLKLDNGEVRLNIIHSGVGAVTESDVMLASASHAIIIGFNVSPPVNVRKLAEKEEVDIRLYRVIYEAIDEVKRAIKGMLAPEFKEVIQGQTEVRQIFKVSKIGTVAGCHVLEGKLNRNSKVRVIRDGLVIHEGTLSSLKRFKDDVREVASGYDCGLTMERYNDLEEGDILEAFSLEKVQAD